MLTRLSAPVFSLPLTCGMPDLLLIITILAILFLLSSPKFPASLRLLPTTFPSPLFAPSLLSRLFLYPEIWSSTFLNTKKIKNVLLAGLISALLLTFGGNLHPLYKIIKIDIQNNGRLNLNPEAIKLAASTYWYPDATRFIGFDPDVDNKTIHEFPLYSFVVSDLHGHMNDIPLILFFLAFLFSYSLSLKKSNSQQTRPPDPKLFLPSGLFLSIAYMTNAWDLAVYGLFFALFFFFGPKKLLANYRQRPLNHFFWYLFTLPYSLNFIPMAEGLNLVDVRSPFYQLCVLYGGFWLIAIPFCYLVPRIVIASEARPSYFQFRHLYFFSDYFSHHSNHHPRINLRQRYLYF